MNFRTLKTILLTLFFLSFSGLFFYLTIKDKFNFVDRLEFYGLERIPKAEIKEAILDLQLKEKNFWQINPKKISQYLSKRPLVKDLKIRTNILPKAHYKIYFLEESVWALYRNSILNQNAEVIINSDAAAKLYESQAVEELYQNTNLIKISSYSILSKDQLKEIQEASQMISRYLSIINNLDSIHTIYIDSESNLTIESKNYKFILGSLDEKLLERVSKIEQVSYTAKKLKDQLDYIDLSLSTNEVIIGRKN